MTTPDDLVERVARALCDVEWGDGIWDKPGLLSDTERKSYRELATAAIAIALEEAARVAEIYEYDELEDDGGATIKPSAAIRAMMEKKND
jgi:hypothetical protein